MTARTCMITHLLFSGFLGLLILLQTVCGKFGTGISPSFLVSWGWFFFCSLPLFLFLLKHGGLRSKVDAKKADGFAFVAVLFFGFLAEFSLLSPTQLLQDAQLLRSLYWMIPAQVLVLVMISHSIRYNNSRNAL